MNRQRLLRTWALPLVLAVLASWSVRSYLTRAAAPPPLPETAAVVVVTAPVAGRTLVPAAALAIRTVARELVPPGACTTLGTAVDRMALVPLYPGEVLLESKLAPAGERPGLALAVPAGRRAVAVLVNEVVGAGGFIEPGDSVDVVATFAPSVAGADRSLLLLQNLLVLAVAQETASRHGPVRELRAYTSVTLAVTPEEATLLVLAEERGSLRLLLRPLGDNTVTAGTIEATTDRFRRSGP